MIAVAYVGGLSSGLSGVSLTATAVS